MVIILLPRNSDKEMKYFTRCSLCLERRGRLADANKYFPKNNLTLTKWKFPCLQCIGAGVRNQIQCLCLELDKLDIFTKL